MLLRHNGCKIPSGIPEDGFYFVENGLYKLSGDFIEGYYEAFLKGSDEFIEFRKTLDSYLFKYNTSKYYARKIWTAINNIYTTGYYEDLAKINWLISLIIKKDIVGIDKVDIPVFRRTGYKDRSGDEIYEGDYIYGDNGEVYQVKINTDYEPVMVKPFEETQVVIMTHELCRDMKRRV